MNNNTTTSQLYKTTDSIEGDEMRNLQFGEDLQEDSDNWIPETPGDFIIGQYIDKKTEVGQYNQTVYILRDPENNLKNVYGTTVLNQKMQQVDLDSIIKITYTGTKTSKHNSSYKVYKVQVAQL